MLCNGHILMPSTPSVSFTNIQVKLQRMPPLKAGPEAGFVVGGESAGANISAVLTHLAADEKLHPPLTGQFLSARTFLGHQNMPDKYKARYLGYEQCQSSQTLTGSVHEMFMCK
jgi:hypothetical protein